MKPSLRWGLYAKGAHTVAVLRPQTNTGPGWEWMGQTGLRLLGAWALVLTIGGLLLMFTMEGLMPLLGYVIVQVFGAALFFPRFSLPLVLPWLRYHYIDDVYEPDHVQALEVLP